MDERAAITQLKQSDISGLETLVRQHYFQAVRTAYLITHNVAQAEDVVQTAFLRVYERVQQFDSLRPFAPWFSRIVVNDAIKAVTRQSSREVGLADEIQAETSSDDLEPQAWLEQLENTAPFGWLMPTLQTFIW